MLFRNRQLDDAANSIVKEFAQRCPVAGKKNRPLSEDETSVELENMFLHVARVRSALKLGILGRAHLAYKVQGKLAALGYPPEMVSKVVSALVIRALVR
jgi:hypothetical protein